MRPRWLRAWRTIPVPGGGRSRGARFRPSWADLSACARCASTELLRSNASTLCAECTLMLAKRGAERRTMEAGRRLGGLLRGFGLGPRAPDREAAQQRRLSGGDAEHPGSTDQARARTSAGAGGLPGPRPYRREALHGNDIAYDNRAVNLRWGSRRENLADRRRIIAERLRELQAACLGKELEA